MRRSGNETEVNWGIGSRKILTLVFVTQCFDYFLMQWSSSVLHELARCKNGNLYMQQTGSGALSKNSWYAGEQMTNELGSSS